MYGDLPKAVQETKGAVHSCFYLCARIFDRALQTLARAWLMLCFLMDNWLLEFLLPKDGLIQCLGVEPWGNIWSVPWARRQLSENSLRMSKKVCREGSWLVNRQNEDLHGTGPGNAPKSLVCSMCPAGYPTLRVLGHQISIHEKRNLHSREVATPLSSK